MFEEKRCSLPETASTRKTFTMKAAHALFAELSENLYAPHSRKQTFFSSRKHKDKIYRNS
jgi:hypothetical protein